MPAPLVLLLAVFATYRLTRLVTADAITEPLRVWADVKSQKFGYLLSCDWCLSMWVAPPVAVIAVVWGDNRVVLGAGLALMLSALTGLLATVERRIDQ
jgi:hypothetical protein